MSRFETSSVETPWIDLIQRSEDHAKTLMKTVVGIKIKNLAKYEKDWRRKKEAERLAEDPVTRCKRRKLETKEKTKNKSKKETIEMDKIGWFLLS